MRPLLRGAIRFEDDDKASSSEEAVDSSREDLSHAWSEDDSDHYVLRRRSLARRPIRARNRQSVMSIRSVGTVSSGEEGEASEYPASSSQRSTLENRPPLAGKEGLHSLQAGGSSEEDDLSQVDDDIFLFSSSYLMPSQVTIAAARDLGAGPGP